MEAFARAMIDSITHPDEDVHFNMCEVGGPSLPFPCRDFLHVRRVETNLLSNMMESIEAPRVLDIGCGAGRHLIYIREQKPRSDLAGVELSGELRGLCAYALPRTRFFERFEKVPDQNRYDLILLMGNGLGIFEHEDNTRQKLRRIFYLLNNGGWLLLESGNRSGFITRRHTIEYQGLIDGPFDWGYASEDWVRRELGNAGFTVMGIEAVPDKPEYFVCSARKMQK